MYVCMYVCMYVYMNKIQFEICIICILDGVIMSENLNIFDTVDGCLKNLYLFLFYKTCLEFMNSN